MNNPDVTEKLNAPDDDATKFWMPVIMTTLALLLACVISGHGDFAIAFAILIHAEIRCLEHDEKQASAIGASNADGSKQPQRYRAN